MKNETKKKKVYQRVKGARLYIYILYVKLT
jgi:hypothetical protein